MRLSGLNISPVLVQDFQGCLAFCVLKSNESRLHRFGNNRQRFYLREATLQELIDRYDSRLQRVRPVKILRYGNVFIWIRRILQRTQLSVQAAFFVKVPAKFSIVDLPVDLTCPFVHTNDKFGFHPFLVGVVREVI